MMDETFWTCSRSILQDGKEGSLRRRIKKWTRLFGHTVVNKQPITK